MTAALVSVGLGFVPVRLDLATASLVTLGRLGAIALCLPRLLWLETARLIGVSIAAMHQNLMAMAIGGRGETVQLVASGMMVTAAVLTQWPVRRRGACT